MIINGKMVSQTGKVIGNSPSKPISQSPNTTNESFGKILNDAIKSQGIKFSKHAEQRIQLRNINISPEQRAKMEQAINKVQEKGVKDALLVMDNMAFIVNVKSRTVVTAVNNNELKDNVFTNIDGAVFA